MNSPIMDRESCAANWDDLVPDLASALQSAFDECVALDRVTVYVEMWPDTGRFICYPIITPEGGELAERDTEFLVQLSVPFWAEAWHSISADSVSANDDYEQLTKRALKCLTDAYNICGHRTAAANIVLHTFEFEGSEGVWTIANDADHGNIRTV
jgi:hypothetical protein